MANPRVPRQSAGPVSIVIGFLARPRFARANQAALAASAFLFPRLHSLEASPVLGRTDPGLRLRAPTRRLSAPDGTCTARSVFNLQHLDSFDRQNPWKHKNAANADGFCLLVFLKMALVHMRGTSRDGN